MVISSGRIALNQISQIHRNPSPRNGMHIDCASGEDGDRPEQLNRLLQNASLSMLKSSEFHGSSVTVSD